MVRNRVCDVECMFILFTLFAERQTLHKEELEKVQEQQTKET